MRNAASARWIACFRSMKTPFFSIVIPTKGRSSIVGGAIRSALSQTYPDFEVVVCDNDDGDATAAVTRQFNDVRLRHHRTGGLSMPDNWEAGCSTARGEFLVIIEDKQALRKKALETIASIIRQYKTECVRWLVDTLDDTSNPTFVEQEEDRGTRLISSDECLDAYIHGSQSAGWREAPIGHLSTFSRSLLERIRSHPPHRVCPPVAPDYSLAILALAHSESFVKLDAPLVAQTRKHSNGRSLSMKTELGNQFVRELGGDRSFHHRVPIAARLNPNIIWNDYVGLRESVGGKLTRFPVDWPNYFVHCQEAIMGSEAEGVDMSFESTAWAQAFDRQPPEEQARILSLMSERLGNPAARERKAAYKKFKRRLGLAALETTWRDISRRLTGRKLAGRFSSAIEYVEWMDRDCK